MTIEIKTDVINWQNQLKQISLVTELEPGEEMTIRFDESGELILVNKQENGTNNN